jgi:ketosteroid isomerase-like protein
MRYRTISAIWHMLPGLTLAPMLLLTVCAHPLQAGSGPPRPDLPKGLKHEIRHEIDHLEDAWRNAVLKQDTSAMEALLAVDYMGITAHGTLLTKEQTITNLRAGRVQFKAVDFSDRKVRFYGKTAVVTSLAAISGTTAEGDVSGNYRYTHVYVQDARGGWKIVSFEASRIRELDEHK